MMVLVLMVMVMVNVELAIKCYKRAEANQDREGLALIRLAKVRKAFTTDTHIPNMDRGERRLQKSC